jgi:hypothetical protein
LLNAAGGLKTPAIWDYNDNNFYVDPEGHSRLKYLDMEDPSGYVSSPWVYAKLSTPLICLNGDCRSSWPAGGGTSCNWNGELRRDKL